MAERTMASWLESARRMKAYAASLRESGDAEKAEQFEQSALDAEQIAAGRSARLQRAGTKGGRPSVRKIPSPLRRLQTAIDAAQIDPREIESMYMEILDIAAKRGIKL